MQKPYSYIGKSFENKY